MFIDIFMVYIILKEDEKEIRRKEFTVVTGTKDARHASI